jgi:ATP-dependent protease ClpP protease subunit
MAEVKEEEPKYVKVLANEIYFHTEVTSESVLEFNIELQKLDKSLRKQYIDFGIDHQPTIKIFINSPGGDVHCGLSAMDHISNCKSHVVTVADGCTASAAALMYLGGHERRIKENAYVLIHQLSTDGMWGTFNEMKAEVDNCEKLMKCLYKICRKKTLLPDEKLAQLMTQDVLLNSKKCIKYGIAELMQV